MNLTIDAFFARILPTANFYGGTTKDSITRQKSFTSHRALAVHLLEAAGQGHDAWFALAGFKQNWYPDPSGKTKTDGTPKKVFRTAENAEWFKAFWLDFDCGVGKPYATQPDAARALSALCRQTQLPAPMVVNSGNGIHAYWTLTQQIKSDVWLKIASLFAAVVAHAGANVDTSVTTDRARILRPIDTFNFKDPANPKPVKLLRDCADITPIDFARIIKQYATANHVQPYRAAATAGVPANIANNPYLLQMFQSEGFQAVMGHVLVGEKNKNAQRIIERCEQVRTAGRQDYPNWWNMITVMNCCPDGRDHARALSQEGPKYDARAFEDKFTEAENNSRGPAFCDRFDQENPGVCVNCPFYERVRTPAELGRMMDTRPVETQPDGTVELKQSVEPVAAPVAKTLGVKGITTYPLDDQEFTMREGVGLFQRYTEGKGDDEVVKERQILDACFHLMYSVRISTLEKSQQMQYVFLITAPGEPNRQASMTADHQTPVSMGKWFFDNQLLALPKYRDHVERCMRTYLAKMQRRVACVEMKENFGWSQSKTPDGVRQHTFVVGDRMVSANKPVVEVALPVKLQRQADLCLTKEGSLDGWKAVPRFFEEHKQMWGQFGIALAFAAPLMKFAPGIAHNGIVNFYARESGSGKTTLQQVINSVWGHPKELLMTVKSTDNSRFNIMGMRCNLPITINEITNLADRELSDTLFQISEGQEKDRLGDGGKDLLHAGRWSTISILSANNTVFEKMQSFSQQRDGEIKRVLECHVPMSTLAASQAHRMTAAMQENYGHAGETFIQNLVNNPKIIDALPSLISAWVEKHTASQDERYWMNTIGAAVVAANLANRMGLTNIDVAAIEAYALSQVAVMRKQMMRAKDAVNDALGDFLAERMRNLLIVASAKNPNMNKDVDPMFDSYVKKMPLGDLDIRVELDSGQMWIRRAALNTWASERGLTAESIVADYIINLDASYRLGKGTMLSSTGSQRCFLIKSPVKPEDLLAETTDENIQQP